MDYNITVSPYQKNIVDTQYHFKQQDYGAKLKIFVEDYNTSNTTCRIVFRRSDGVVRQYTITQPQLDGSYIYDLSADETYSVGKCIVDLKFYDVNKRESTASFIYYVDKDEMGQHFESGDYFDAITEVVGRVETAIDNCESITEVVEGKLANGEFNAFTPKVLANPNNNGDNYRLDITNDTGTFTTPNLKGADGNGAGDMTKAIYDPNNRATDIFTELDSKVNKTSIVNNTLTTAEGTVLDGRVGKTISDKIGDLSSLTTTSKTDLVSSLNEVKTSVDEVNNNLINIDSDLGNVTSNINTIKNNIYTFVDLQPSEYTKSLNSYINCETGTVGSVDWLNTIYIPCISGQIYDVSTCIIDASVAGIVFLNSSDEIISYVLKGTGTSSSYLTNYKVTIPINCVKMAVTETPSSMSTIIKKYTNVMYNGTQNILNKKKMLFAGDSFQQGMSNDGGWAKLIKESTGANTTNVAVGGSTIAIYADRPNGLYNQVVNRTDKSEWDYLILEGVVNDYWIGLPIGTVTSSYDDTLDINTTCGALEAICRDALKNYNSKVCFIIPYKTIIAETVQQSYISAVKQVLKKYSINYLDLYELSALNPQISENKSKYFNSDGIHINAHGYNYTANLVTRFIESL